MRKRWFPAALALWFAALVGLTIMVLPPALLASWSGMDTPSLPQQGLAALVLALGAGLGAGFAARIAAQRKYPSAKARPTSPPPKAETAAAAAAPATPVTPATMPDVLDLAAFERFDNADPMAETPDAPPHETAPPPLRTQPRHPLSDAPLDTLGIVELLERLALAIVDWRERHPGEQLPATAGLAIREVLRSRSGEDRWTNGDESDEGEEGEVEDEDEAGGYSSLLDITARHRMIRRKTAPDEQMIVDSPDGAYPSAAADHDPFAADFIDGEAFPRPAQAGIAP